MLVLSRRLDETVLVPNLEITIRVLKVGRNSVVLGINAPDAIRITRSSPHNSARPKAKAADHPAPSVG